MGGSKSYQARTAVLARESEADIFRFQKALVAAEVVGECVGGDGGDGDFVQEIGCSAGPDGLFFEERGDGIQDGIGGSFVQSVDDGCGVIGESRNGPVSGVGVARS